MKWYGLYGLCWGRIVDRGGRTMGGQMPHPDPQSGHNPFCLPPFLPVIVITVIPIVIIVVIMIFFVLIMIIIAMMIFITIMIIMIPNILIEDVCATGRCSLHPGSKPVKEFAFNEPSHRD